MQLEARLLATVSRLAGPVRGAGVVLISLFGALSVGSALGWALFGFVVVTAVADFWLPRVALPVAFVRVVVLSVVLGGAGDQWALTVLTTTLITWQLQWPLRVTVPLSAALLAVHVAVAGPAVLVRAVLRSPRRPLARRGVALEGRGARVPGVVARHGRGDVPDGRARWFARCGRRHGVTWRCWRSGTTCRGPWTSGRRWGRWHGTARWPSGCRWRWRRCRRGSRWRWCGRCGSS
ncbi:hypothetical protein [Lentzea guizhouensis]|uniref:hypothetical protein n=1 Tax=Lentzea guizhouensis TaxID=1586287 RepID=UPI0014757CD8|nr:hypothetical protein [Lentzea guizhouensis]